MSGWKRLAAVAAMLAVGALGVTFGWAASGDSNQINACADKQGNLRMLTGGGTCTSKETAVDWSITGPQGAPGPQGVPGPQGPPGPTLTAANTVIGQSSFKGTQQGQIKGGDGEDTLINISGFTESVISPRDAASGLPTGKRQHKPITLTKEIDAASPRLYKACATNENLPEVVIDLYARGGSTTKTTVKLTNASCSALAHDGQLETITFTFQKIEWTYVTGAITYADDWEAVG